MAHSGVVANIQAAAQTAPQNVFQVYLDGAENLGAVTLEWIADSVWTGLLADDGGAAVRDWLVFFSVVVPRIPVGVAPGPNDFACDEVAEFLWRQIQQVRESEDRGDIDAAAVAAVLAAYNTIWAVA